MIVPVDTPSAGRLKRSTVTEDVLAEATPGITVTVVDADNAWPSSVAQIVTGPVLDGGVNDASSAPLLDKLFDVTLIDPPDE
jgi:hypothetical protein